MSCPKYLYDELFPIEIHRNDYYGPYDLTTHEKIYIELYYKAKCDKNKVDLVMCEMVSKFTVEAIKKHLIQLGLIDTPRKLTPKDAKEFTIINSNRGLKCEWCGRECYTLQEHHYPVLARDDGKDTVHICPNCHYTYHKVMGNEE